MLKCQKWCIALWAAKSAESVAPGANSAAQLAKSAAKSAQKRWWICFTFKLSSSFHHFTKNLDGHPVRMHWNIQSVAQIITYQINPFWKNIKQSIFQISDILSVSNNARSNYVIS